MTASLYSAIIYVELYFNTDFTKKQEETPAFYAVYEDENIFVADKESGVNAEAVFAALARSGGYRFIHRIDRNTKGLLVFAKNGETETALLQAFKERAVEKTYHALCFGALPKANDLMTAYLKKDEKNALYFLTIALSCIRIYREGGASI